MVGAGAGRALLCWSVAQERGPAELGYEGGAPLYHWAAHPGSSLAAAIMHSRHLPWTSHTLQVHLSRLPRPGGPRPGRAKVGLAVGVGRGARPAAHAVLRPGRRRRAGWAGGSGAAPAGVPARTAPGALPIFDSLARAGCRVAMNGFLCCPLWPNPACVRLPVALLPKPWPFGAKSGVQQGPQK